MGKKYWAQITLFSFSHYILPTWKFVHSSKYILHRDGNWVRDMKAFPFWIYIRNGRVLRKWKWKEKDWAKPPFLLLHGARKMIGNCETIPFVRFNFLCMCTLTYIRQRENVPFISHSLLLTGWESENSQYYIYYYNVFNTKQISFWSSHILCTIKKCIY